MAKKSAYDDDEGRPNLTPMIDCVFLLLIFFMVTAVFTQTQKLRIELPEAMNPDVIEKKQLQVALSGDGQFEVNGRVVASLDALVARLDSERNRVARGQAEVEVILRADGQADYEQVLRAMKRINEVATRVSIASDKVRGEAKTP